jgi:serine/threonine protein kinase
MSGIAFTILSITPKYSLSLPPPLSQVRLSIDRFTGQRYACKIVDKKKFLKHAESSKRPLKSDALLQEVAIMQQLSHPNIVRIFECFETSSSLYIILELLQVRSCVCLAAVLLLTATAVSVAV